MGLNKTIRKTLDCAVRPLGLRVIKAHALEPVHLYQYANVDEYHELQVKYNKNSISNVWADPTTLTKIAENIKSHGLGRSGICHGARNGFEVKFLRDYLEGDIIGTDISDSALEFPHIKIWDFHDDNPQWRSQFDFVYTNSLDHAMEPDRALRTWAGQLVPQGRIYIEHSTGLSSRRDPFGAHSWALPYLFFKWGRGIYELIDIIEVDAKENNGASASVFVLRPNQPFN